MHNKYIITHECHYNAPRMWKVVQLEKYFDFSLYSHHFSLLSLTSLLLAPEREVNSPSDFKVVWALVLDHNTVIFQKKGVHIKKSLVCKTQYIFASQGLQFGAPFSPAVADLEYIFKFAGNAIWLFIEVAPLR